MRNYVSVFRRSANLGLGSMQYQLPEGRYNFHTLLWPTLFQMGRSTRG